jgi:hypothetical protein
MKDLSHCKNNDRRTSHSMYAKLGVVLPESCQLDVPKSVCTGSLCAYGGR